MNAIADEHKKHKALWAKNRVAKIATWIADQGGAIKVSKSITDLDEEDAAVSIKQATREKFAEEQKALTKAAATFIGNLTEPTPNTPSVVFNSYLPVSRDRFAVLLVRETDEGYLPIGTSRDPSVIASVKTEIYRRTFGAMGLDLRCVLETLLTQHLPGALQARADKLIDPAATRSDHEGKAKAMRRFCYIDDLKACLLSPARAVTGVVTLAKPADSAMFHSGIDTVMAYKARERLEHQLLRSNEYNLYRAEEAIFPARRDEPEELAYMFRLNHITAPEKFVYVDFWANEQNAPPMSPQVFRSYPVANIKWQHLVSVAWCYEVIREVIDYWLDGSAKHITRDANKVCQFKFGVDAIEFGYNEDGENYSFNRKVEFAKPIKKTAKCSSYFLVKDILPALKTLGEIDIVGDVDLCLDDKVLALRYLTAAGTYEVIIPRSEATASALMAS